MAKKEEPIYIDVSGETITIFVHNYLAKQGTICMAGSLVGLGIFHQYMIEAIGLNGVIFLALFLVLLILSGINYMKNNTPLMIMDNEKMSFPREHPEPVAWCDLKQIDYKQDHMVLHPKRGEPVTIWVDHRWPLPCFIVRDMMIKKRREADIRLPPDHEFFIS